MADSTANEMTSLSLNVIASESTAERSNLKVSTEHDLKNSNNRRDDKIVAVVIILPRNDNSTPISKIISIAIVTLSLSYFQTTIGIEIANADK